MDEAVTFAQIKGSVASLLLVWAQIERTARDEVARAHGGAVPKSAHGLVAVLNAWEARMTEDRLARPYQAALASRLRALLQRPLEIRNGVCHGLVGIVSSCPGKPATLSWDMNGNGQTVTWDEMQEVLRLLSRLPRAFSVISHAAAEPAPGRAASLLPDRDWWAVEFGIDVPDPTDLVQSSPGQVGVTSDRCV